MVDGGGELWGECQEAAGGCGLADICDGILGDLRLCWWGMGVGRCDKLGSCLLVRVHPSPDVACQPSAQGAHACRGFLHMAMCFLSLSSGTCEALLLRS